ncbi:MAG: antibiotic biosynthesis monooxygenase [Pseudomonadota bacterium]|nr:antibiotic biosynthesis monooxygenase [Pseudomonadota bacterium]
MDDGMYVSVSRLRVEIHQVDRLIDAFRARAGLVDAFPGFVSLEVWRSQRSPDEVLMVSRWRARADFTAYMKSDAHQHSHDRIPADLQAAIRLEQLDHVTAYDVMAR